MVRKVFKIQRKLIELIIAGLKLYSKVNENNNNRIENERCNLYK